MSKPDGGPAFPRPIGNNGRPHFEDSEVSGDQEGMALRDYFAAKAMAAFTVALKNTGATDVTPEVLARASYQQADAMLKERNK